MYANATIATLAAKDAAVSPSGHSLYRLARQFTCA